MCVPHKLKSYFHQRDFKVDTDTIVRGKIMCCSSSEFDVLYFGNVKKNFLGHISLYDNYARLIVRLRCRKCRQEIEVFNSLTDGYDRCIEEESVDYANIQLQPFCCSAQTHSNFSVEVTFEYPPRQELLDEGILDSDNAFSWIRITLKCNACNKTHKNFVSFETA